MADALAELDRALQLGSPPPPPRFDPASPPRPDFAAAVGVAGGGVDVDVWAVQQPLSLAPPPHIWLYADLPAVEVPPPPRHVRRATQPPNTSPRRHEPETVCHSPP
eukprot:253379-Prymnesium_polylepis.1